jgi:hypothetical protein
MQCVAQGAPYVIGSLAALRVMGGRPILPGRRRADATDGAATSDRSDEVPAHAGGPSNPADDASR